MPGGTVCGSADLGAGGRAIWGGHSPGACGIAATPDRAARQGSCLFLGPPVAISSLWPARSGRSPPFKARRLARASTRRERLPRDEEWRVEFEPVERPRGPWTTPGSHNAPRPKAPQESVRTPPSSSVVGSRPCPVCRPVELTGRQTVCSAQCRRARTRQRRQAAREARDQEIRVLSEMALRKLEEGAS